MKTLAASLQSERDRLRNNNNNNKAGKGGEGNKNSFNDEMDYGRKRHRSPLRRKKGGAEAWWHERKSQRGKRGWDVHEQWRQRLVGPGSALWSVAPALATVLLGSIPSRDPSVVSLRARLRNVGVGGRAIPSSLVCARLAHSRVLSLTLPRGCIYIYIYMYIYIYKYWLV